MGAIKINEEMIGKTALQKMKRDELGKRCTAYFGFQSFENHFNKTFILALQFGNKGSQRNFKLKLNYHIHAVSLLHKCTRKDKA